MRRFYANPENLKGGSLLTDIIRKTLLHDDETATLIKTLVKTFGANASDDPPIRTSATSPMQIIPRCEQVRKAAK